MRLRNVFVEPRPIPRVWIVLAWIGGGLVCALLGLALGFKLWAPQVVAEYQAAVASTPSNTLIYASGGELIATISGAEDRHWIPLNRIHPFMQKAAVAIEDRRFFLHRGMDPVRLAGAVWADLRAMSLDQGGSTITQQLVKLSLLSSERTMTRKVRELFMAVALEQEVPKLEILESYLNKVYLGYGMYGVETAAQGYFGKSADSLTLNEAAFLAALIKKPEGYLQIPGPDPHPDSPELPLKLMEPLMKRQRAVVEATYKLGWISDEDLADAHEHPLHVQRPRAEVGTAPYFVQQVQKELKDILAVSHISGGGYRVMTTLDLKQQRAAEAQVARVAHENREASQAALVAMDPATGYVRALVGGVDFAASQFNRATQALRQPGSAFKPILYAAALEHGFSPVNVFHDEPVRFVWSGTRKDFTRTMTLGGPGRPAGNAVGGNVTTGAPGVATDAAGTPQGTLDPNAPAPPNGDQVYEPRNFDGKYGLPAVRAASSAAIAQATGDEEPPDRRMTLGRALELSSNVIAVQLLDQLGMTPVVSLASRFNLTVKPEIGLCVALGCGEVTLLNLTAAYGAFANGGLRVQPVFIRAVTNAAGDPLYARPVPLPEQVVSEWTAFQMRHLLEGVIERGTGQRARLGRPAGGKTGTNDGPRDTWFIGFTPELVAGVWIGNDDNRVMPGEVGGRTTARAWSDFMRQSLSAGAARDFPEPSVEYVSQRICNLTGHVARAGCPDVETYAFLQNEVPAEIFAADDGESFVADDPVSATPAPPTSPTPKLTSALAPTASSAAAPPMAAAAPPPRPFVPVAAAQTFGQRLRDAFSSGAPVPAAAARSPSTPSSSTQSSSAPNAIAPNVTAPLILAPAPSPAPLRTTPPE
jgi:membrane peptidoglycan carboxypeptidase